MLIFFYWIGIWAYLQYHITKLCCLLEPSGWLLRSLVAMAPGCESHPQRAATVPPTPCSLCEPSHIHLSLCRDNKLQDSTKNCPDSSNILPQLSSHLILYSLYSFTMYSFYYFAPTEHCFPFYSHIKYVFFSKIPQHLHFFLSLNLCYLPL